MKKKISKWPPKKRSFFKIANSRKNFSKISWIGPWVSRIDWCEGHWCGSNYMVVRLSDISSKTGKKCIFGVFRPFLSLSLTVSQPSMFFASINPTNERTNPRNFHKKVLRIGDFEKEAFFCRPFWNFFCFILMLKGQSLLVSKDGLKFWCLPWFPAKNDMDETFLSRVYLRRPCKTSCTSSPP